MDRIVWLKASLLSRRGVCVTVIILAAVGAFLRLYNLGGISMRIDELNAWGAIQQGATLKQIATREVDTGSLPFTVAYVMVFVELLNLPWTFFTYRLPAALVGIAAIPLAYWCGALLSSRRTGLVAALLIAIHPVHVQCSREMYPYVFAVTGAFASAGGMLLLARAVRERRRPSFWAVPALAIGVLLLVYCTATSWPYAVTVAIVTGLLALTVCVLERRTIPYVILLAVILLAVAGPKAWEFLIDTLSKGGIEKYPQAAYHKGKQTVFTYQGFRFLWNFAWGDTPARLVLGILSLILVGVVFIWRWRDIRPWVLLCLVVLGFVLTSYFAYKKGNPIRPRFLTSVMPAYVLLLSLGITELQSAFAHVRNRYIQPILGIGWVSLMVGAALFVAPLVWSVTSNGHPPYTEIVRWADNHLPPGTPILCDRYFTPWFQLRWNASTNCYFMSTVPNEPPSYYPKSRWRETAEQFLKNNSDAAFYEERHFWKWYGPWTWPHEHFARSVDFLDRPSIKLRRVGLSYRGGSGPVDEDKFTHRIYYNTEQDLVRAAAERGEQALVVYGPGWKYTKTKDYRDWRVMEQAARLAVWNLTLEPRDITITIRGVAPGASKTIAINNGPSFTVKENTLGDWRIPLSELPPGKHWLALRDAGGAKQSAPLLVERISISQSESVLDSQ